ncbi:Zinc finger ZZ-type [Penicillium alfredii]|uniref:Zinc finger ZZ-type n=1 Tax=Penicillium alfredii TaxID=1506179 RepID=A0A9W9KQM0_9EURO|nr:Zinc finger ZZ-type [Penicillium alfredii]KAJ5114630.1 Zinc finger ZZ-type [Penicillium alfredii]
MATSVLPSHPVPDHLITIKALYNDNNRRFKLPLKDLKAQVFPQKLRSLLGVPADVNVILERYSDSAGSYIRLDCDNPAVYKQLHRAAKAKSKLRVKVTTVNPSVPTPIDTSPPVQPSPNQQNPQRNNYLETVLSSPIPVSRPEARLPSMSDPTPTVDIGESQPKPQPASQPLYRDFEIEQDKQRFPVIPHNSPNGMFCIDCNNCGRSIANEHYHCSICERGDYDLCPQCVDAGASCRGDGHWLIKRVVEDGLVTNSTTETIPPRAPQVQESKPKPPQAEATPEPVPEMVDTSAPTDVTVHGEEKPICNGCCREADESNLVRCDVCEDYDLCLRCLLRNKHGHHPAHTFQLGTDRNFCLKNLIMSRCLPGRQFKHAAVCDGCDKRIMGTRHKCLSCPDWDYCAECIVNAHEHHPHHRFVPIYEHLEGPRLDHEIHYGIFCDGPLCKDKPAQSYITGVRYKCAVCEDTDFCANCEAHPHQHHNRTHPLVQFKTPVRSVTVSTIQDDGPKGTVALGDNAPVSTPPAADMEDVVEELPVREEQPVEVGVNMPAETVEKTKPAPTPVSQPLSTEAVATIRDDPATNYQAYFIRDTITDGSKLPPSTTFNQTWTLYNPGPYAWPAGSDVRFVGGDTMFNVDATHPSSVESIRSAMESNKLPVPLEVGQSADFTVTLRTPRRAGAAISYWRLKLPNGMPIGHRLWCDVRVQDVPSPAVSEPTPTEKETDATSKSETIGRDMIFPKLDKESPETSTHEAAVPAPQAPTLSNPSEGDVLEDVESLTLDEADTDAGFLTDEEYDVLDASDQEFLDAKQSVK